MNMIGSLRYHPSGRKRKTTALKTKRRAPVFVEYMPEKTLAMKQVKNPCILLKKIPLGKQKLLRTLL